MGSDPTMGSAKAGDNAFVALASLPPNTDKATLMSTIDMAVTQVLSEMANHEGTEIDATILAKVQTALAFLERCLAFKDDEFTAFSRKRANELQTALAHTLSRIDEAKKSAKQKKVEAIATDQPAEKKTPEATPPSEPAPTQSAALEQATPAASQPVKPTGGFIYEREEGLLIAYAYERFCKRLAFLRGDTIVVEKGKAVTLSGINEDGVAPFFLLSPKFPEILYPAFCDLIREKRDLLSRRVYIHTNKDDDDAAVTKLYAEERYRDIDGIIGLAFDDWAGEIARAGLAGLPQEIKVVGPKKSEDNDAGIGSSLKKVFSFGKKDKKPEAKKAAAQKKSTPIRIYEKWQELEAKGVFDLSQHFSFGLLSYALQLSEKQFETEFECIRQIVDQQDEADVGPVITNLSRLYKFYDNIFFDLVIVVLFQRKNKFDINMLQAACMSQNFVVDRLPLTMDELRRRPMEHAKHILHCLKQSPLDKEAIRQALVDYFYVHETIHASKVGKRIQASENLLKRQGEKLEGGPKAVIDEIKTILGELLTLKKEQEEEGVFLGEEMQTAVEEGITRALLHIK